MNGKTHKQAGKIRETKDRNNGVDNPRSNSRLRVGATAVAVVGVAVIALGAVFFANNQSSSAGGQASGGSANGQANGAGEYAFQVGDPGPGAEATPIELPSTDGGKFNLSATRGETTLLYFHGGVMCQPCYDQVVDIEAQWGKFEELGIDNFAGITHDPLDASKQAVNTMELSTPVLYDEDLEVSKTYDANEYGMMNGNANGHTFIVVGPEGEILWRADYGGAPDYTMYMPVQNLLADMRAGLDGG